MRNLFVRAAALAAAGSVAWVGGFGSRRLDAQPAAQSASRGRTVYEAHCARCHGPNGQGDGPAAALLNPRPRNFTTGNYEIRTTETGSVPTDDDLIRSVRQGLFGSAMPGWDKLLSDSDIRDVVDYIKTLSPRFRTDPPKMVMIGAGTPSSADSVKRGRTVYEKLKCAACHGTDGRGTDAIRREFEDEQHAPLHSTDLAEPWTFDGGATPRDIYLRFRTGMSGTPMPSFADAASDKEMWDLANYIVSLARKPLWEMDGGEVAAFYAQRDAQDKADPVKRGGELVQTLSCVVCHTSVDDGGRALPGMRLAGGLRIRIEPFGDYFTGNLTSDKETGLGSWTDDEIKRVITRGTLRDGTRLLPFPMDWPSFSTMRPEDINAIVAYLRTVPPVSNKVPRISRTFLPVFLWGKFRMLIMGGDPPMIFYSGNAGTKGGRS
jgi:cbb3-type cytochrome c oxidase subunit III